MQITAKSKSPDNLLNQSMQSGQIGRDPFRQPNRPQPLATIDFELDLNDDDDDDFD